MFVKRPKACGLGLVYASRYTAAESGALASYVYPSISFIDVSLVSYNDRRWVGDMII
jgi:hypothetical protein